MRVTTAFSWLLRLGKGVVVKQVRFEPDRVIVEVALRRRRLICPECGYSTRARKDTRPENSVWRHLDLGVWRLEVQCQRRRLWCPEHGARTEGVPFARPRSEFTRDFECLVAWLATRTDKTTITQVLRIDWGTVGRIIKRVCDDELDADRLNDLYDIGIDEVSWKRQHNYSRSSPTTGAARSCGAARARARKPPTPSSPQQSPHERVQIGGSQGWLGGLSDAASRSWVVSGRVRMVPESLGYFAPTGGRGAKESAPGAGAGER